MKTVAELKEIFGLAKKPAILDEDGVTVLVPERLAGIEGYNFYFVAISSLTLEQGQNPVEAIFREAPTVAPIVAPVEVLAAPPEGAVIDLTPPPPPPPPLPLAHHNRMAVCDIEYVYVATMGDFPEGTLMVE